MPTDSRSTPTPREVLARYLMTARIEGRLFNDAKEAADVEECETEYLAAVGNDRDRLTAEVAALRARVAELEGALAFYADETNYCDGAPGHYVEVSYADGGGYEFREDDGDIARRVLAAYDREV